MLFYFGSYVEEGMGAHSDFEKRANEARRKVDEAIGLSASRMVQSTERLRSSQEVLKRSVDAMARTLKFLAKRYPEATRIRAALDQHKIALGD
jgi:hypothetical protein